MKGRTAGAALVVATTTALAAAPFAFLVAFCGADHRPAAGQGQQPEEVASVDGRELRGLQEEGVRLGRPFGDVLGAHRIITSIPSLTLSVR